MSIHPTPGHGCHNAEVAAGLRTLAAFLDDHPELPDARFAIVSVRSITDGRPARESLEVLAAALGPAAREHRFQSDVEIRGEFGPVHLKASASVRELADVPRDELLYEPIIRPSLRRVTDEDLNRFLDKVLDDREVA